MSNQKKNHVKNPDLTIEKVRQFKGFENISDEAAENIIDTLKQLSLITYEYYITTKQKKKNK